MQKMGGPEYARTPETYTSIVVLALVAAVMRWLFCYVVYPSFLSQWSLVGEQYFFDSYRGIAFNLLHGNGYRETAGGILITHRPPGYLPVLMLSFPGAELSHKVFQFWHGMLGALAAVLTWKMARLWGATHKRALVAGYCVALWPFLIWETKVSVPENLLVALVPAVFVALGLWLESRRMLWLVVMSLLAAWLSLTHGIYQVFLVGPLLGVLLARDLAPPKKVVALAMVGAIWLALVVPWMQRNERIMGYPVGVAASFGFHYFKGLHNYEVLRQGGNYFRYLDPEATEAVAQMLVADGFSLRPDSTEGRSDPEVNRHLGEKARRHLQGNLLYTVQKVVVKMPLGWIVQRSAKRCLMTAILVAPFILLALYRLFWHFDREVIAPLASLLAVNAAAAAVYIEAIPMRYVLPLLPLLFVIGCVPEAAVKRQRETSVSESG